MVPSGHVTIPCICSGKITSHKKDNETFEVSISNSPIGELHGPFHCALIYPPGFKGNYKRGDRVRVLANLYYDTTLSKFVDTDTTIGHQILGRFDDKTVFTETIENPNVDLDNEEVGLVHEGSGISVSTRGQVTTASGAVSNVIKANGFGVNKNSSRITAQNHHRVVSHNAPFHFCREHFGLYEGETLDEESTKTSEEDYSFIFRRFISQSKNPENYTTVCEGTFAPWVGANNDYGKITKSKEILYSRIVNHGNSRVTIDMGEPGDTFVSLRVDDVINSEQSVPTGKGAVSGILGNRCKVSISDKGAIDILSGGAGISGLNSYKFHLSVSEDGDLTILSSGKIKLSHGDKDESLNSIVMDPSKGVDITAVNGFRVNGKEVVNKSLVDWINQNQATFCQTTAVASPASLGPATIIGLQVGLAGFGKDVGFVTNGIGLPATGIISEKDIKITV